MRMFTKFAAVAAAAAAMTLSALPAQAATFVFAQFGATSLPGQHTHVAVDQHCLE